MTNKIVNRLWVGFTISLISFISFSSQIFVIWPWYGYTLSVDLLKLLLPFNALVYLVYWNYRLCVITPPGAVPRGWRPNMAALEGMEVKSRSGGPRYCKTCEQYKPPRAHHCRQCKTCVLKLDHHCPWIANCVGFHNQGHFIRFLVSVNVATSFHIGMMVFRIMDWAKYYREEPTLLDMLSIISNIAACVPVWICVGCFSLYHLYLASGNTTTVEGWEKDKVATLIRRGKIREIKYPYNIGIKRNLQAVLGPNPLLWFWPQKMLGDGLSFPVNPDAGDPSVQYLWPPTDPTRLPNPPPPRSDATPFIYGNNGLNPNLKPSSAALRSRENRTSENRFSLEPGYEHVDDDPENFDGGIDQGCFPTKSHLSDRSDSSRGSSPERYLSDYDSNDDKPLRPGERFAGAQAGEGGASRVRRGSEGWEVRPGGGWNTGIEEQAGWEDDIEGSAGRPWENPGRYNVYEQDDDLSDEG